MSENRAHFVSLGMFIIDQFDFLDAEGKKTGETLEPQIGGGGVYAAIGARIWLPPNKVGMIVDRGHDFPGDIQAALEHYGPDMWLFRDNPDAVTTRAVNIYQGDHRGFQYLTPRRRISPNDLSGTKFDRPSNVHFICSPTRAQSIMKEIQSVPGWHPVTIFEPIPMRSGRAAIVAASSAIY